MKSDYSETPHYLNLLKRVSASAFIGCRGVSGVLSGMDRALHDEGPSHRDAPFIRGNPSDIGLIHMGGEVLLGFCVGSARLMRPVEVLENPDVEILRRFGEILRRFGRDGPSGRGFLNRFGEILRRFGRDGPSGRGLLNRFGEILRRFGPDGRCGPLGVSAGRRGSPSGRGNPNPDGVRCLDCQEGLLALFDLCRARLRRL